MIKLLLFFNYKIKKKEDRRGNSIVTFCEKIFFSRVQNTFLHFIIDDDDDSNFLLLRKCKYASITTAVYIFVKRDKITQKYGLTFILYIFLFSF